MPKIPEEVEAPVKPKSESNGHGKPEVTKPKTTKGKSTVPQKSKKRNTPSPKNSPRKSVSKQAAERPVIYEKVEAKLCTGEKALTQKQLSEILGWTEEPEGEKWGRDAYDLVDENGKKVKLLNNPANRPIYASNYEGLTQEVLQRRWAGENNFPGETINGETIIIGRTGIVLNGQHQCIAAKLAEQIRVGPQAEHWNRLHGDNPITLEKLVVRGISESDRVVNTMDTCKPRSLADVIYRSKYFTQAKVADRKNLSRILDYAVRLLWQRTGAKLDAYAPTRTHAEALDFVERHPKLLKAVKHIYTEDKKQSISKLLSSGAAAGCMYLMATCKSKVDDYLHDRCEKRLDLSRWDAAEDFWVKFSANDTSFKPLRLALGALVEDTAEGTGSLLEKCGVIANAWGYYLDKETFTPARLKLEYVKDEDNISTHVHPPEFGGIDLGDPHASEKPDQPAADDPKKKPVKK